MNDLTPYEQELAKHLNDLPLPDEDRAWQDMKELLDNGDDKGGGKKPPSDNGIWGIALLILLLTILVLWYAHSKKQSFINDEENKITKTVKKDPATETGTTTTRGMQTAPANAITENNSAHNNELKNSKDNSTENISTDENNVNPANHPSSGNKNKTGKFSTGHIQSGNNNTSPDDDVVADNNNPKTGNHLTRRTKFLKLNNKKRRIKIFFPYQTTMMFQQMQPLKKQSYYSTKPNRDTIL